MKQESRSSFSSTLHVAIMLTVTLLFSIFFLGTSNASAADTSTLDRTFSVTADPINSSQNKVLFTSNSLVQKNNDQNTFNMNFDKYNNYRIKYSVTNTSSTNDVYLQAITVMPSAASISPSLVVDSSQPIQTSQSDKSNPFTTLYSYHGGSYGTDTHPDQPLIALGMGGTGVPGSQKLAPGQSITMSIPVTANSLYDFTDPKVGSQSGTGEEVGQFVDDVTSGSSPTSTSGLASIYLYTKVFKNIVLANEKTLKADNYNDLVKAAVENVKALFNDDATKDTTTDPASIVKVTPGTTAGNWYIDYNYNGVTKHLTGTTTSDDSYIDAKDFTIPYGSNWDSQKFDGLTKHIGSDGNAVTPLSKDVTVSTNKAVDTTAAGSTYDVTYTIDGITKIVKVTVGQRGNIPSNNNSNNNNSTNNNGNSGNSAWNPSNPSNPNGTGLPNYAAVKGSAVYATKGIYMYRSANFKKSQRTATYPKAKRVNRPMFVVLGYNKSNGGALRYKVRDVNHGKNTDGKIGYITANPKYVVNVYYKTMPKSHKITVINKKGIHAYKNVNLTGRVKTFKKGTHVTVKSFEKHNLTTRYKLSNGTYITANKKLVIQGNY